MGNLASFLAQFPDNPSFPPCDDWNDWRQFLTDVSGSLHDFARKNHLDPDALRDICVEAVAHDDFMEVALNYEVSGSAPTTGDAPLLFWLWSSMEPWGSWEKFVNEALRASVEAVPVTGAFQQLRVIETREEAHVLIREMECVARQEAA